MTEIPHEHHQADHQRIGELRAQYVQLGTELPEGEGLRGFWAELREIATGDSKPSLLLGSHVALDLAHSTLTEPSEARALTHRVRNYLQDWSDVPITPQEAHSADALRFQLVRAFLGKQFVLFDHEHKKPERVQMAERRVVDKLRDNIRHPNFWDTMHRPADGPVQLTAAHQASVTHLLVARYSMKSEHARVHSWPSFLRQEKASAGWDLSVSSRGFYAKDAVKVKFAEQTSPEPIDGVRHVSTGDWGMPLDRVAGMLAHEAKVLLNLEALRRAPANERTKFSNLQGALDTYSKGVLAHLGVLS